MALDRGEVVITEVNVVEVSEPGDLSNLSQSLGNEEDAVRFNLLELHPQVESGPQEWVSPKLVKSPTDSGHAIQILHTTLWYLFSTQDYFLVS